MPQLRIEFFNYVPEFKQIGKLEIELQEALNDLPEYNTKVAQLGVFMSHKLDKDVMLKADSYTGFPNPEVWICPQGFLMVCYFYGEIHSIVVFFEDYSKCSVSELRRTIRHELTHAICGHRSGDFRSPGYFGKLPKKVADSLKNRLINHQQDYEVDSFLAKRCPELILDYLYGYSKKLSLNIFKKMLRNLPNWAKRLELTIFLVDYYRNLLILKALPDHLHSHAKFKRAKKKFENMFKASRLWLKDTMYTNLPPAQELISPSDFQDQYKLKLWFCKTVELDQKQPIL